MTFKMMSHKIPRFDQTLLHTTLRTQDKARLMTPSHLKVKEGLVIGHPVLITGYFSKLMIFNNQIVVGFRSCRKFLQSSV